jgi:hypothetical protein
MRLPLLSSLKPNLPKVLILLTEQFSDLYGGASTAVGDFLTGIWPPERPMPKTTPGKPRLEHINVH